MHTIIAIPAFNDNYIWLIKLANRPECVIVDPGSAQPVLQVLEQQALQLVGILVTHHHGDHTGGINSIIKRYPVPVYGPANDPVNSLDQPLREGDSVSIPECQLNLKVIEIPGHTLGHIAYYGDGLLFCGDTLFLAGCGRVFEGTAEQMLTSLKKLKALPDDTQVYCAHEYTLSNLAFANALEPSNQVLQQRYTKVKQQRQQQQVTIPASLAIEKQTNPFLRCDQAAVIQAAEQHAGKKLANEVDVFVTIRQWKNNFVSR